MKSLILDTAAGFVFLIVLSVTHSVPAAVIVGGISSSGLIAWLLATRQPVSPIQWLSLALVVGLGGVSLATRDARFVMIKPSLVQAAIGCALLEPGWLRRYIPAERLALIPQRAVVAAGYAYALMLFALAATNLAVALIAGPMAWAAYSATAPALAFTLMGAAVYLTFRALARRRRAALPLNP